MDKTDVTLTQTGSIAWITIDNRDKHNAMSLAMWHQLGMRFADLPAGTRCVVLRGAGKRAFVSGADISEFAGRRRSPEDVVFYDRTADEAMDRVHNCEIPHWARV